MQINEIHGSIEGRTIEARRAHSGEGPRIEITIYDASTHETEWRPEDMYAAANYILAMTRGVRRDAFITDIDGCEHPAADVCGSEIHDLERILESLT